MTIPATNPSAGPSSSSNGTSHIDTTASPHMATLASFADKVASEPERFALTSGDSKLSAEGIATLKEVFSRAVRMETASLPSIGKFLRETLDEAEPTVTRAAGAKGKKRKRAAASSSHELFPPSVIDSLVTDGMGHEQIWQQLEFRGQAIENVLSKILVSVGAAPPDEEDGDGEADDEVRKKNRHDEEAEDDEREIAVSSLSSLSDAELRALGIDPAMREELLREVQEGDDEFEPGSDEEDEEEEPMYADGYPGASDLSSDEDDAGSSKRVYYQPLRTEREQRIRKRWQEREEMRRIRALQMARAGFPNGEQDSDEEEEDDDETADLEDDVSEPESEEEQPSQPSRKSLLDSLDEPGTQADAKGGRRGFKGPRHKSLDDDFFSIDDFNRQTEESERREIFKEAGAGEDDEQDDIDYFRPTAAGGDEEEDMDIDDGEGSAPGGMSGSDIRYSDFFDPPPRGSGLTSAQKRTKGKGKGSRVGQGAKLAKQERDRLLEEQKQQDEEEEAEDVEDDFAAIDFEGMEDDESVWTGSENDDFRSDGDESESEDDDDGDDELAPARPNTRVKFNPQVAIRNIKARANKDGDEGLITPEMLRAMSEDGEEQEESDEEGDEEGEDEDDEDEAQEVDSEMGDSVGGDSDEDDADAADADDGASLGIDSDEEVETAHRFADDLFGDEDDEEGGAAAGSSSSSSRLSAHERRLAELQQEIARLENENVSAKDWTLSGEASSRARPKDSLLEQDLDFEQSSKPTPTITVDVTEALEELIKRRILENRFDDVVPRRAFAQPEYKAEFELSDRKSGKSLAEEYEEQYTQGGEPIKGETEKRLDKERTEIESLMEDIFDKLDALSNAHFTPKAPKATITTLTSAPSLNVEGSTSSQLAPQEVFNSSTGEQHYTGSKSEMTPKEKAALFAKQKKNRKHERLNNERAAVVKGLNASAGAKVSSSPKGERQEKQDALKKLIGNKGVSVVGKGERKSQEAEKKGEKFKL